MNSFVTVIVIVAVFVGAQAGDMNDPQVKAIVEKCAAAEKPTPADLEALQAHSMDLTKEAKCMISCMLQAFGLLSADGKLQKDVFMKHAQEESKGDAAIMQHATEIFDICSSKSAGDICETAFQVGGCVMNEMKERNIPMIM